MKIYVDFDKTANQIIEENNLNPNILKEINNIYSKDIVFNDAIYFLEKYHHEYDLILLTLTQSTEYQQKN